MCFETSFEEAAQRKESKYANIVEQARLSHYTYPYYGRGGVKRDREHERFPKTTSGVEHTKTGHVTTINRSCKDSDR